MATSESVEEADENVRARANALFAELTRHDIDYVVIRGGHLLERAGVGEMRVLVRESQLRDFEEIARRLELKPQRPSDGCERLWSSNGGSCDRLSIVVTTTLGYGRRRKCLGTGPHEDPVLRRRRGHAGVSVASASDELVDLVLHCILDSGAFSEVHRERMAELIAELRADPPAAGRAAERFQQELSPALPWSVLLADVVHGRWDDLLARRRRIARHLVWRFPLATVRGWVARENGSGAAAREDSAAVPDSPSALDSAPASESVTVIDSTPGDQPTTGTPIQAAQRPTAAAVSRKQIRGSSLFLVGRGLSAGLKFAAELVVVRYLATSEYGSWTYALAAVAFFMGISTFGLNRAIARYLPLHLERGEIDKFYGVLVVVTGLLVVTGTTVITTFYAFPNFIAGLAGVASERPLELLFILIFLVPLESLDNALTNVCAALGVTRPIFVRRFLLYPGLRLVMALILVATQSDVAMLAYGYVLAGSIGIGYYAWAVVTRLRSSGLLRRQWLRRIQLPFGRVLGYTTPNVAADWCAVFMTTAGPLLLGYFTDMSTVALYQVVIPVAALNHLVPQAFVMLFEPSASRLVARGDRIGLERHYWRTAMWVSVLSFPLFALSFTAAVPTIDILFGERYAAAAPILSLLALSQFVEAAAGFNAAALRVDGKVRWLIAASIIGVAVLVGVSVLLIPSMGALGAGIGTAAGQLCYTTLKQTFVRMAVGVKSIDAEHASFYITMGAVGAVLLAIRLVAPGNLWIILPAVLVGVWVVFMSARRSLSVTDTFPELQRIPLMRKMLG